ncbi:MAG: hypothetical protein U0U66_00995 [Cytophagaceae bacterium]
MAPYLRYFLLTLLLNTTVIQSFAQEKEKLKSYKSLPPKDSIGKDYAYYFNISTKNTPNWTSFKNKTNNCLDSFYFAKYTIIKKDSVAQVYKFRMEVYLKSHGMLKNTHRPVYSDATLVFDVILNYDSLKGVQGTIKRLQHHYTFNEEDPKMGHQQPSMRTMTKEIKIPLIQSECGLYDKKIKMEANDKVNWFIQRLTRSILSTPKVIKLDEDED